MYGRGRRGRLEVRVHQREERRLRRAADDAGVGVLDVTPLRRSGRINVSLAVRPAAMGDVMDKIIREVDRVEFGPLT
jgi:hypothetical protein